MSETKSKAVTALVRAKNEYLTDDDAVAIKSWLLTEPPAKALAIWMYITNVDRPDAPNVINNVRLLHPYWRDMLLAAALDVGRDVSKYWSPDDEV